MTTPTDAIGRDDALGLLQAELARVGDALAGLVGPGDNVFGGALGHLIGCGGKMLRPLLTVASAYAAGGERAEVADRCVQAAAAVEMLHVGTLCHDDVMDEAATRRGAASVNAKWGNSLAILCGDVLIARAIRTVAGLGPAETAVLSATLEDLCAGQAMETAGLFDVTRTRDDYLRSIELKTASLFAASCQLGALAAGWDAAESGRFAVFGRTIGVAFQIVDDVLDLVGSAELLGKPPGSDLREGVLTLPTIDGMQRLPQLRELLSTGDLTDARADQARRLILDSGAVDAALDEARRLVGAARAALHGVPQADIRYVATLVGLAESVLERGLIGAHQVVPGPLLEVVGQWRGDGRNGETNENRITAVRPGAEVAADGRMTGGLR